MVPSTAPARAVAAIDVAIASPLSPRDAKPRESGAAPWAEASWGRHGENAGSFFRSLQRKLTASAGFARM